MKDSSKEVFVAPSLLSADFSRLNEEIKEVEDLGVKYLHFDVMDGHFVDNISFGIPVLKSIAHTHHMINDVHIMISEPKKYVKAFSDAGADILTFHYEACSEDEVNEIIDLIHNEGIKAGLAIKPGTDVEKIIPYLSSLDLLLVMSVEPGFGGQEFILNSLSKIKKLDEYRAENNLKYLIEVDGGINRETAKECRDAGVDILVAGNYIFKNNKKSAIEALLG
ncbi:MAG: ribulose-phosphate 3-epimerase [Coprobacillus sp.]|nr:ribulose-phosphate 3-epimerase [Coprobacillus sp.]